MAARHNEPLPSRQYKANNSRDGYADQQYQYYEEDEETEEDARKYYYNMDQSAEYDEPELQPPLSQNALPHNQRLAQPPIQHPYQPPMLPPIQQHSVRPPIRQHPLQPQIQQHPLQPPMQQHPLQHRMQQAPMQQPTLQTPIQHPLPPPQPHPSQYPAQYLAQPYPQYPPQVPTMHRGEVYPSQRTTQHPSLRLRAGGQSDDMCQQNYRQESNSASSPNYSQFEQRQQACPGMGQSTPYQGGNMGSAATAYSDHYSTIPGRILQTPREACSSWMMAQPQPTPVSRQQSRGSRQRSFSQGSAPWESRRLPMAAQMHAPMNGQYGQCQGYDSSQMQSANGHMQDESCQGLMGQAMVAPQRPGQMTWMTPPGIWPSSMDQSAASQQSRASQQPCYPPPQPMHASQPPCRPSPDISRSPPQAMRHSAQPMRGMPQQNRASSQQPCPPPQQSAASARRSSVSQRHSRMPSRTPMQSTGGDWESRECPAVERATCDLEALQICKDSKGKNKEEEEDTCKRDRVPAVCAADAGDDKQGQGPCVKPLHPKISAKMDPRLPAFKVPCGKEDEFSCLKRREQWEALVKDQYCPGAIQDTVDDVIDFNEQAMDIVFGDYRLPECLPNPEPITLIEALFRRVMYERCQVKKLEDSLKSKNDEDEDEKNENKEEKAVDTTIIEKCFKRKHQSDLNNALCKFLIAERLDIAENPDPEQPTMDMSVDKATLELPGVPISLTGYTGTTKPRENKKGEN